MTESCSTIDHYAWSVSKWNDWGFGPLLCTYYTLNRARITSWQWWDELDDTALQTQNSKFGHWPSEAGHAPSRSRELQTILNLYAWAENKYYEFLKLCRPERGSSPRSPKQVALTTAPGSPPCSVSNYGRSIKDHVGQHRLWFYNVLSSTDNVSLVHNSYTRYFTKMLIFTK